MSGFRIYQISLDADKNNAAFRNLQSIRAPNSEIYELVYDGELQITGATESNESKCLAELFCIFNTKHPKDYCGRSMSVSDVVELYGDYGSRFFFCDSIGFQPVEFDKSRILKGEDGH